MTAIQSAAESPNNMRSANSSNRNIVSSVLRTDIMKAAVNIPGISSKDCELSDWDDDSSDDLNKRV